MNLTVRNLFLSIIAMSCMVGQIETLQEAFHMIGFSSETHPVATKFFMKLKNTYHKKFNKVLVIEGAKSDQIMHYKKALIIPRGYLACLESQDHEAEKEIETYIQHEMYGDQSKIDVVLRRVIHHGLGITGLVVLYTWYPETIKILLVLFGLKYTYELLDK